MNLPQGWTAVIDSPTQVVPGALKGLPINLNPPENWDKKSFDITVQIIHPTLGIELLDFTVKSSNFSFSSSPVLWGGVVLNYRLIYTAIVINNWKVK